jgi:hypothetical protein
MSETLHLVDEQAAPKPKKPITEAQRAARRANARKSTGPRTAAGKFRSSLNSLRHGAYAKTFTLKTEDQARFQSVIDDYIANFNPQSYAELEFIEQMATASWRRRRIATIINEKINQAIDTVFAQVVQPSVQPAAKPVPNYGPPFGPIEFTITPAGSEPTPEPEPKPEPAPAPETTESSEPTSEAAQITPEALTELAYEHIARTQPSLFRLEAAERQAAASFRAAFRGLQNYRAFLDEEKQREDRRNEATAAALYQSADNLF